MTEPEKRILLIVDPQIDFISGSLPIPGAREAMDQLAEYIRQNGNSYRHICITCDRHPLDHSSFREYGGEWPVHCVRSSVGAAVWPAVMDALPPFVRNILFLYKGENPEREEYSIFGNEKETSIFNTLLSGGEITQVDICGLAGDVCVKTTLEDALRLYPDIRFRILEDFTASLDGGKYVRTMIPLLDRRSVK